MRSLLLLPLIAALGLSSACNKVGPPSPDYQQARTRWLELLKQKMDKAYADPGAEEVLALLAKVDPKSVDAPHAATLRADVEKGRAEALAAEAALQKQIEGARAAATSPTPAEPASEGQEPAPAAPSAAAAEAPDAGAPEETQPKVGMPADEFSRKFSRCFEERNEAAVGGQMGGKVWVLKDLMVCRELHPDFKDRGVVLFNGKLDQIQPLSDLEPAKYKLVNGQLVPVEESPKK